MKKRTAALALAATTLLLVSGCAGEPASSRLVDAKSIVQLVRNEAGARVPTESVAEFALVDDASKPCAPEDEDPQGLQRRWSSTSKLTLVEGAGEALESTYLELINSFSANGWSEVTYGGGGAVTLQKPGGDATLGFVAESEDAATGTPATILIAIESGCVETGGAESDEVTLLETGS